MNKHHYLQISFLLFFFLCAIAPLSSQTPTASFATWKDNKKAAYSIIHDDYSDYVTGIFQYADPIATSRGIKLCFGAITNFCGATEWANARTMIAHGHECVNHSHNHLCGGSASECSGLSTYNASQFPTELGLSSQLIETNTGVKPRFFIHPYDASSTAIINYLTGLGYLGTRSGNRSIVNDNTFTDFMHLNYFVYMPNSQILLLNQAVDQAVTAGGYTIREFHGIEDGSWAAMTVANYTDHLNYVKTQMDNGNIWSATTTEAITYKIQRDAFQPVASRSNLTGDITVSFNTLKTIDPSVLRTPVTVNVNLNGITGNFNVTQIGTPIPSTRTGNIVTFNVYPHQGNVVLNYIDVTPPVLTACHTNISLTTTGTTAVASWTAPTATDNASIPIVSFTTSPTAGLTNGGAFPIGTTTVRYTATDAKNNTATCSFTVTVTLIDPCATDIIPPVLTACPSNISLTTNGTTALASWTAPTGTDNCTIPIVSFTTSPTVSLTNGGAFPIGTTTVTYTASDVKNSTICSFTVMVMYIDPCATDIIPPVLTACPSNISLATTGTTAIASWTAPTATDNCTTPSVTFATSPTVGLTNGGAFPIGTTTVRYTATDAKNNTATCSFSVSVTYIDPCLTDITPPVLTVCPANTPLATTGTTALVSWTAPTATDNCTPPSVTFTTSPTTGLTNGSGFPIGTTTVTYTATDAKNNTATCSFSVIVTLIDPCLTDITPPVLTACPANISLTTTGTTATASWTAPTATDNCTIPIVSFTTSPTTGLTNGGTFPIGTTTVRYTATDAKNNTETCSFTVSVTLIDPCATDIIPPVLTACPANISLTTTGATALASWTAPTATDNCTIPIVSFTTSPTFGLTNGGAFPIGTTTVRYTATDAKNNTSTCSFNVVVTLTDPCATDVIPPVLTTCSSNISLTTTGTTAIASWTAPTATDNCTIPIVSFTTSPTVGLTNGGAFPIGTTTVRYTATDAKNNTATCSFTVVVTQQSTGGDVCTQPTTHIQGAVNAINVTGIATSAAHIQVFSSFWSPVYSQQVNTPSATVPNLAAGGYYIKVTVLGAGGIWPSICEVLQPVTVTSSTNPCITDATPPVLSACPANMNLTTATTTAIASWTAPTATDNCSTPSVSFTSSPTTGLSNGGAFPIGTTTVTYTATDAKNNTATCRFTVTVTQSSNCAADIVPPLLTSCPANMNLTTATTTTIASWTAPTATDNCTTPSVIFTTSPTTGLTNGGTFPLGTTTVRYTATDAKNNTATCSFTLGVTQSSSCATDIVPPVLTACPANMNLTTATTTTIASWTAPTATDNCSPPSVIFTSSPTTGLTNGGVFPIGTTTVRYTAKDAKNNTATCSFTVTVTQQSTGGNICTQPAANIVGSANAITISGITTSAAHIQIFTSVWSPVYSQLTTTATVNVPNLAAGGYFVKVTVLGAGGKWPAVCDVQQNVTVAPLVASLSQAVLALEAHAEPTRAVIEWVNNTGYINDYFTIEKADTKTGIFETLEIVNNKSVDKDMTHYVTYDNTPTEGDNSYRIAVIHNDGSTKVSDIKTVQFKGLYSVRLFPNPVNDVLTLDLSNYKNQNVEVYLYNYFGHLQLVRKIDKVTDALFDISVSDIQTGNYKVRIQSKKRRAVTQSVIIAH